MCKLAIWCERERRHIFAFGEGLGCGVEKGIQTLADMGLISISWERGIIMHCLVDTNTMNKIYLEKFGANV